MDKSKLEAYASLKVQIAELEEEAKKLNPEIVAMMQSEEADKINTEYGSFTLEKKRTYTFSDAVELKRVDLKEMEAKEKADGTASYEENAILKFTKKKVKEDITG